MAAATFDRPELVALCGRLGYPESLRVEDFVVWTDNLVADVACFALPERHDMSTATIVAGTVSGDRQRARHFAAARALAAPVCVVRSIETWQVYSIGTGDDVALLSEGSPPDTNPVLARFLAPDVLLAAKREPEQMSLFDIDIALLDDARGTAGHELDRRVRRIIAELLSDQPEAVAAKSTTIRAEDAARLVVRALTALAARDKLTADRSLVSAIARVQELSPSHLQGGDLEEITTVAERLGHGINFRSLDPSLLGDVYERAVLVPAKRLALGAYYTPPEIARKILDNLPIEHVEPDKRRFLDPSCGTGTLLLAANERLMTSLSDPFDDRMRHDFALDRLVGSDNDPFAVELARLALFLQALPYGNGYSVESRDALIESDTEATASFTVSNPPWGHEHRGGVQEQRADRFLRRLVRRTESGGFVACVLPVSWLTSDTSRDSRAWLREQADIFEVWRLPTHSFRTSKMAPCVVFAQVGRPPMSSYRYLNVWNTGRQTFRDRGVADEILLSKLGDPRGPLTASWLGRLPELADTMLLSDVATIRDGVPVQNISKLDSDGPHRFLRAYGTVPAFGALEQNVTNRCRYPTDFSKRSSLASPELYLRQKVLVSAMTSVDVPWRLRGIVDRIGVIPRNSMYAVIPNDRWGDTENGLMGLLGLLSSAVASLWVAQRTATRMINARTIATLPIPSEQSWSAIIEATACVTSALGHQAPLEQAVGALDKSVFDAFKFSSRSIARIHAALEGHKAPEGVVRFKSRKRTKRNPSAPAARRAGAVVEVREGELKVDVPGLTKTGGTWIPAPSHLPGWIARPGTTFDVIVAGADLGQATFRFQGDSWMTFSELIAQFA